MLLSTAVLAAPIAHAADVPKAPVPKSPYLPIIYRYADTMLERGRDSYGPQKTGLFLSALDRTSLSPLTNRPPAAGGVREDDRVGNSDGPLVGSNPQHDQNFLRLLYTLSELSGKAHYRQAADAELKWFVEQSAATESLPWDRTMSWDVLQDRLIETPGGSASVHELFRPWMLWDRCFELAPQAGKRFALRLAAPMTPGMGSRRHAGFHIRTWAVAYARTKDEEFLKRLDALLAHAEKLYAFKTGAPENLNDNSAAVALAIDCDGAAHHVSEPRASRLRALAAREDEVFCASPHDVKNALGFLTGLAPASGTTSQNRHSALWRRRGGTGTTAQIGMLCVSRYDNTGKIAYRDLILAAADAYLDAPPKADEDPWPVTFGQAISLQLAAWRHSAKPVYLEGARRIADLAVEKFWGTNALPKASFQTDHHEAITGADTLALALVELHLNILHITAVRCPPNTIER